MKTVLRRQSRDTAVDLLKTIAVIDVLLIHVSAPTYGGDVGTAAWLTGLFWGSISRCGVPLFLMCSGALLLDPKRPLTWRSLFTRRLGRLLAALLFWATFYGVHRLWLTGSLNGPALLETAKRVVLFRHEEHLYYLHIMLLVYACLPVSRLLAERMDDTTYRYALGLWFLVGIVYPTVKIYWPFTLLVGIPTQWLLNMTYASIGYTLLGDYLSRRQTLSRRCSAALALVGFVVVYGGTYGASLAQGSRIEHFLGGMTVGVCLLAVGVYGLCQKVCLPEKMEKVTVYLSKASFAIFLTHIFFLHLFLRHGFDTTVLPVAFSVPLLAAAVLGCSCLTYEVLRRIPVVNRWLI